MSTYKVKKPGKEYAYEYERSRFVNNSSEYNRDYYRSNREILVKRRKIKAIEANLTAAFGK